MSTYFVLLSYVLGIYVLQHDINSSKTTTVKVQNTTRVQGISNKKLIISYSGVPESQLHSPVHVLYNEKICCSHDI